MRQLEVINRIAAPERAPLHHRFTSRRGTHLFIVPHSRIYDLTGAEPTAAEILALARTLPNEMPLDAVVAPAPQAISLNVSSKCNLACGYCYAGQGSFGGAQTAKMTFATAAQAIERLFAQADATRPVTVGFLGGEPLVSRKLVHEIVAFAEQRGQELSLDVRFSITTNGTLLEEADRELFRSRPFAVTVSIDGDATVQDAQRPGPSGRGSFADIVQRVRPLLDRPGRANLSARATVTAPFLDLRTRFEALAALGFEQIGFSPLRHSPSHTGTFAAADWSQYLDELSALARLEADRALTGQAIRLGNLLVALEQLHRGASSPYPCGAGGGYFSIAADGRWYACHRGVGEPAFELGNEQGLDDARRREFLQQRHVHAQAACATCFARYLCSGGCHHEASSRSDSSCGFIRGWLEVCLAIYCELESP